MRVGPADKTNRFGHNFVNVFTFGEKRVLKIEFSNHMNTDSHQKTLDETKFSVRVENVQFTIHSTPNRQAII